MLLRSVTRFAAPSAVIHFPHRGRRYRAAGPGAAGRRVHDSFSTGQQKAAQRQAAHRLAGSMPLDSSADSDTL
jgi:hypothetical protein